MGSKGRFNLHQKSSKSVIIFSLYNNFIDDLIGISFFLGGFFELIFKSFDTK